MGGRGNGPVFAVSFLRAPRTCLQTPGCKGGEESAPHGLDLPAPVREDGREARRSRSRGSELPPGAPPAGLRDPNLGPASLGNLLCAVLNGALDPPCAWPVAFFFPFFFFYLLSLF